MNDRWNLDPLYKGFDDPAFEADLTALKEAVAAYAAFTGQLADAEPLQALRDGIAFEEKITTLASKVAEYAMLRQSTDAKDPQAGSQMGRIMGVLSQTAGPEAAFRGWAAKLPQLMELVRGDEQLKDYEFLFANMADSSRYLLPGMGEEIAAKLRLSGGSAWKDLQGYLTSTVPVSYRGGITNLSSIRNLAYDEDPSVHIVAPML